MKVKLKKQTYWGCMKPLIVYVNKEPQGKLFNCIPMELEVQPGDEISFREGVLPFFRKLEVSSNTREIVITNSNKMQQVFLKFMLLFLIFSVTCLLVQSMLTLTAVAIILFAVFTSLFRIQSYQFEIDGQSSWHSLSDIMKLYK